MIAELWALAPVAWARLRYGRIFGVPVWGAALAVLLQLGLGVLPLLVVVGWAASGDPARHEVLMWLSLAMGGSSAGMVFMLGLEWPRSRRLPWPLLPVSARARVVGRALIGTAVPLVLGVLAWGFVGLLASVLGDPLPGLRLVAGSLGLVALSALAAAAGLGRLQAAALDARGAENRFIAVFLLVDALAVVAEEWGGPAVALALGFVVLLALVPWPAAKVRRAPGPARLGARPLPGWLAWWAAVLSGGRVGVALALGLAVSQLLVADRPAGLSHAGAIAALWGSGMGARFADGLARRSGREARPLAMLPISRGQARAHVVLLALAGGALGSVLLLGALTLTGVAVCATASLGFVLAVDTFERQSAVRWGLAGLLLVVQPFLVLPAVSDEFALGAVGAGFAVLHLLASLALLLGPGTAALARSAGTGSPLAGGAA